VQFEITETTRRSVQNWIDARKICSGYLFPSRHRESPHLSRRQYARIVDDWVKQIGLDPAAYGTHSMRRTQAAQIYRKTGNLRAVQLLLGHTKLESTVWYLGVEVDDVRAMLEVVGRGNPALAHGFLGGANVLAAVDERLPKAVLRCALATCIRPRRGWDLPEDETAARADRRQARIRQVIDAEMAWLAGDGPEPDWPVFPAEPARRRPGIRLPGGKKEPVEHKARPVRPDEYVDHQAAALWLGASGSLFDLVTRPWVRDLVRAYATWTAAANGAGLDQHDEVSEPPYEWNNIYFDLLARCLPGMAEAEIDKLALAPTAALPDEPFFDVVTLFLRAVDDVHFNDRGLQEREAVHIRAVLADRLMASSGWRRLAGKGRPRSRCTLGRP
jgi:hypothetical protein